MARIIVFSGAGLSAESGIPTFRDSNGLWENHNIDDVANYHNWRANRSIVHKFYNDRRSQLSNVSPNLAHRLIASWQKHVEVINITQNVDDLLERAGSTNVIHLHGYLPEMQCTNLSCNHIWNMSYSEYRDSPCPKCGSVDDIKPHIVMFNEYAPKYQILDQILKSLTSDDVFIVVGTLGNIVPIGLYLDGRPGKKILVNLEPSEFLPEDIFDNVMYEPATSAFAKLDSGQDISQIMVRR